MSVGDVARLAHPAGCQHFRGRKISFRLQYIQSFATVSRSRGEEEEEWRRERRGGVGEVEAEGEANGETEKG